TGSVSGGAGGGGATTTGGGAGGAIGSAHLGENRTPASARQSGVPKPGLTPKPAAANMLVSPPTSPTTAPRSSSALMFDVPNGSVSLVAPDSVASTSTLPMR